MLLHVLKSETPTPLSIRSRMQHVAQVPVDEGTSTHEPQLRDLLDDVGVNGVSRHLHQLHPPQEGSGGVVSW